MTKVVYLSDESNVPATEVFGMIFPRGGEVDISDLSEAQQEKLKNNPCFMDAQKYKAEQKALETERAAKNKAAVAAKVEAASK